MTEPITDSESEGSEASPLVSVEAVVAIKPRARPANPSPYPIYLVSLLFYTVDAVGINIVAESVIYNKVCYNHFGNITLCTNTTFTKTHPALQVDAARWGNYVSAIQILPAVFTNLILSSYCDNVGHRLPIGLPIVGFALGTGWLAVLATSRFLSFPIELLLVYGFFYSFLGGSPLMIMSCYSYITRISSPEKMSFNMVVLEASTEMGFLVGLLASGPIVDNIGLDILAYINAGLSITPILVILIAVRELPHGSTQTQQQTVRSCTAFIRDGISHMLDAIKCVFRKRPHYDRLLIHLCYIVNFATCFSVVGYGANAFLFFNKQVGMTLTQLSVFSAFVEVMIGFGGPLVMYLNTRFFKLSQIPFGMISCSALALGYLTMSIQAIPYAIWIGGVFLVFQITVYGIIRSYQIKLVEENEVGRLFAYDGMLKIVFNLLANIMFKNIYAVTVTVYPSLYLVICACLYLLAMVALIILSRISIGKVGVIETK